MAFNLTVKVSPLSITAANDTVTTGREDLTSDVVTTAVDRGGGGSGGGKGLGETVAKFVWMYVCPVILLVGVVGNSLTIAVMRRKRLRGGTVAVYLVLMAVADTCFLVIGIVPEWLEAMDIIVLKKQHPAACKLEKFLGYTAGDTAIWLLVVFTLDRFVAVCFPLRKSEVCTTRRAWLLGGCCLALGIAKNLHVFWTRGAEFTTENGVKILISNCGRPTPAADHFESFVRPWIAFTLVSLLPLLLICTFNIGIVRTLLCLPRTPAGSPHSGAAGAGRADRRYSQTTLMCVSVSVLFLATITPSIVLVIGRPYWDDGDEPNRMYRTAKGINNALVFMNHSLNFFLYCLTGRRFREQLLMLLRSCCCHIAADGFSTTAATKASFYLKTIHKLSQEFISPPAASCSTAYTTTTALSHHSNASSVRRGARTLRLPKDTSQQSVRSLDSDSSYNGPLPPTEQTPRLASVVAVSGSDLIGKVYTVTTEKERGNSTIILENQGQSWREKMGNRQDENNQPENWCSSGQRGGVTKTETRCSVYLSDDTDTPVVTPHNITPSDVTPTLTPSDTQTLTDEAPSPDLMEGVTRTASTTDVLLTVTPHVTPQPHTTNKTPAMVPDTLSTVTNNDITTSIQAVTPNITQGPMPDSANTSEEVLQTTSQASPNVTIMTLERTSPGTKDAIITVPSFRETPLVSRSTETTNSDRLKMAANPDYCLHAGCGENNDSPSGQRIVSDFGELAHREVHGDGREREVENGHNKCEEDGEQIWTKVGRYEGDEEWSERKVDQAHKCKGDGKQRDTEVEKEYKSEKDGKKASTELEVEHESEVAREYGSRELEGEHNQCKEDTEWRERETGEGSNENEGGSKQVEKDLKEVHCKSKEYLEQRGRETEEGYHKHMDASPYTRKS